MKRINFLLISCLLILLTSKTYADFPKTELEFAQLPSYCKAKASGSDSAIYKQWDKKMGHDMFDHMHHYCSGLNGLNKGYYLKEPYKTRTLTGALGGIDYVLERANKNFYLLPEMHLKKGEIYQLLNENQKAIEEFNIAIKSHPKYSPPYYYLANLYMKNKNKDKAVSILNQGLEYNPNSKLLSKKLSKIMSGKN